MVYTQGPKGFPYTYFKAQVYPIYLHGPFGILGIYLHPVGIAFAVPARQEVCLFVFQTDFRTCTGAPARRHRTPAMGEGPIRPHLEASIPPPPGGPPAATQPSRCAAIWHLPVQCTLLHLPVHCMLVLHMFCTCASARSCHSCTSPCCKYWDKAEQNGNYYLGFKV